MLPFIMMILMTPMLACSGKSSAPTESEGAEEAIEAATQCSTVTSGTQTETTTGGSGSTADGPDTASASATIILGLDKVAAKPGDLVKVTGKNFKASKDGVMVKIGGVDTKLTIIDDETAEFITPTGSAFGLNDISFSSDGKNLSLKAPATLLLDAGDFPIYTGDKSGVCVGTQYRDSAGQLQEGSKVCTSTAICTAELAENCFLPSYSATTQPLRAISYDAINAGKTSMRSSLTLAGIAGTLADCSANNAADCVTTATYKSADWTNLTAANIKNGVSVAGLTGTYPSSGNLLSGADSTADLDFATFDAKLKSSSSFEWWGPSGTRYTASGDGDIVEANVKSGVTIFGTTGTYSGATIPSNCSADAQVGCITTASYPAVNTTALSPWDIRMGKTAGGVAGSISFYKNMAATSFYNRTSGTGAAAGLDVYDTIDDVRNSGAFPTEANAGWDQATGASWIRDSVSDTGAGGGTAADGLCNGTEACVYRDQITGVFWAQATATTRTWEATISYCDGLSYGTYSDWRVPTQKEMQQGYIDGIWTQAAASRLNLTYHEYWTATTISDDTTQAWVNYPAQGDTSWKAKTGPTRVICVR